MKNDNGIVFNVNRGLRVPMQGISQAKVPFAACSRYFANPNCRHTT